MRFKRTSRIASAIPTASMADISFLLLVFFMVTTVFVRFRGIPVELPKAEKIERLESRRDVANIWVGPTGVINIDDRNFTLDQVGPLIHAKLTANPRVVVSIKADGKAKFGLISDVLQELRKVEALRVNFSTRREES